MAEQRHGTDHTAYHLVMDSKGPGRPRHRLSDLWPFERSA